MGCVHTSKILVIEGCGNLSHIQNVVEKLTPKIIIPSDGVVNWDGVLKFGGRLKGDHATHF